MLNVSSLIFPVVRDPRTNARVNVEAQSVRAVPSGLPQDNPLPEVAADGRAAR